MAMGWATAMCTAGEVESGGARVPSALCFCGSSAGSLHQLNVCDVQLSALNKTLRKDGREQSWHPVLRFTAHAKPG